MRPHVSTMRVRDRIRVWVWVDMRDQGGTRVLRTRVLG